MSICPKCGHGLRPVFSMELLLCDACGHHEPLPPELIPAPKESAPSVKPAPKQSTSRQTDRLLIGALVIASIAACSNILKIQNAKPAFISDQPSTDKAEATEAPQVDLGGLPPHCIAGEYVNMTINTIRDCLPLGLTVAQSQAITGQTGETVSRSADVEVREHKESTPPGYGVMYLTFRDGRLVLVSHAGFNPYPPQTYGR